MEKALEKRASEIREPGQSAEPKETSTPQPTELPDGEHYGLGHDGLRSSKRERTPYFVKF